MCSARTHLSHIVGPAECAQHALICHTLWAPLISCSWTDHVQVRQHSKDGTRAGFLQGLAANPDGVEADAYR